VRSEARDTEVGPAGAARTDVSGEAWAIEAYFDGACPLCVREMRLLQRLDRRRLIRFVDIAAPGFDAAYRLFARNRLRLTGRCDDGACRRHPAPSGRGVGR
jgi:predicted DCC family thiol-disulfide oxidoreductase YuxK